MRKLRPKNAAASRGRSRTVTVFSSPGEPHRGLLRLPPLVLRCALGRSGVTHLKREGDGATPAGRHRLLFLYVRRDRLPGPASALPARAMRRDDAWCEDPRDGNYNRPVHLASRPGLDAMWREDRLYDIVGVLDWNVRPRVRGRGSAIFLHLCRPGFGPTAGCIALEPGDLRRLLALAGPRPQFLVATKPRKTRPPVARRLSAR
jgi:L,D-peptidoglycan transpeptidase YkuD (ErfK/YbiS/YcfS/YnhG family)